MNSPVTVSSGPPSDQLTGHSTMSQVCVTCTSNGRKLPDSDTLAYTVLINGQTMFRFIYRISRLKSHPFLRQKIVIYTEENSFSSYILLDAWIMDSRGLYN